MLGLHTYNLVIYLWICFGTRFIFAQEKFTLLDTITDSGFSTEVQPRVQRASTSSAQSVTVPSTTKVPYKTIQCPPEPIRITFFSLPCYQDKDCRVFGPNLACCKQRCVKGVRVPVTEKPPVPTQLPKNIQSITTSRPATAVKLQVVAINENQKRNATSSSTKVELVCPSKNSRLPFFSLPCKVNADCNVYGRKLLCCRNVCLEGVFSSKENTVHIPALFGLVDRLCPAQPLAEFLDVKTCDSDSDCLPRICCPERNSGINYCRIPVHNINRLPGGKQIQEPLKNFVSYMQCTLPPPRELFPKACNNTLDCFPNLCCQEKGKKFCRPPKKSLVALVADLTVRLGAAEATRKFIERITT